MKYSTNFTINEKIVDDMLESRNRGGRWKAQTNPLSYGSTPDRAIAIKQLWGRQDRLDKIRSH